MKIPGVLSEAYRNLVGGTSRAMTLAVALGAIGTILGLAEGNAVGELLTNASKFRSSGASTIILSADSGIDGAACERLAEVRGIEHSGAVRSARDSLMLAALPEAPVPVKEATPQFGRVLGVPADHSEHTGLLVSEQVSAATGRRAGDQLWTSHEMMDVAAVYAYPSTGSAKGLEYAVVNPVPTRGHGLFDQCWAEVWPTSPATAELLRLSLAASASTGSEVSIARANTTFGAEFHGEERFSSRVTSLTAWVSLLAGLLVGYISVRLRRLELASARHAGVPPSAQFLQIGVETSVWTAVAVMAAAPVLLYQALTMESAAQLPVWWLQLRAPVAAAAGAILGALVGTALVRERHLFRYFKDR